MSEVDEALRRIRERRARRVSRVVLSPFVAAASVYVAQHGVELKIVVDPDNPGAIERLEPRNPLDPDGIEPRRYTLVGQLATATSTST